MVIDQIIEKVHNVADSLTTMYYGEEAMAEAQMPSDDERVKKIAFVRDGIRLFITTLLVIVIAGVVYFVGHKAGVWSWLKSKFR